MILSRIDSKYPDMTPGQRSIADYIAAQLREAAYMNAKEIATKTGVSESGVVRFAAFLDYAGFKEMQKDIQADVKATWSIMESFQNALEADQVSSSDSRHIYNQAIKNLNETIAAVPEELYEQAMRLIFKADRIGVVGTRVAVAPALTLQVLLNQLVPNVHLVIPNMDTSFDMLRTWGEKDLLIGFSFMRAKNFSYDIISYGKERGCRIISVCDSYRNSIAALGDVVFPVQSESAFLSFVPTMYVIDTLLYKISKRIGQAYPENMMQIEDIINRFVNRK